MRTRRRFADLATPLVLGILTWPAGSAVAGAKGQPEMLLFEEPVITAAAKHAQTTSEAPAAVTLITRE